MPFNKVNFLFFSSSIGFYKSRHHDGRQQITFQIIRLKCLRRKREALGQFYVNFVTRNLIDLIQIKLKVYTI